MAKFGLRRLVAAFACATIRCTAKWFFFILFLTQPLCALPFIDAFQQKGYVEICDEAREQASFDALYAQFDALVTFLHAHPVWAQKLYIAKERFLRSKARNYYSTDFFGLYDESRRGSRNQIAFYYATHFHDFIFSHYPEFNQIPEVIRFFETCLTIQKSYEHLFQKAADELGINTIFSPNNYQPPILLKVIQYLPSYTTTKPHYDGSAFSLFLDSTDNQSLLLSPYQSSYTTTDFTSPLRSGCNSILLIPGTLLTEFSIYPTPHLVVQNGKTRYATIAFAMRPHHVFKKIHFSSLE